MLALALIVLAVWLSLCVIVANHIASRRFQDHVIDRRISELSHH